MSLNTIVAGDYGQAIELTFIDVDTDAAADISAYTTAQRMIFIDAGGETLTRAAAFKTDGTDGVIRYVVEENFLTAGRWRVRGQVEGDDALLSTEWHHFVILG